MKSKRETIRGELQQEYESVMDKFPEGFGGSHHRAYGVLTEEFKELEEELFKRPANREKDKIRREAIQVAVTAILIAEELG